MKQNTKVTKEIIKEHGLSDSEYKKIIELLGREPNITELGIFSVMWSEHCSYKSSRVHLKKFPTEGPQVLQGPGENAGIVDIGDGLAVAFKMESHNHPSFIEPFQGAATGVGGILRDVFTMGARPFANLNSLRFGSASHQKTPHLLKGVVAGIASYGNCLAADERIWVRNSGKIKDVKIGDYCDSLFDNKWIGSRVSPKYIEVLSFDPRTKKPQWNKASHIFRFESKNIIKIKTQLGRCIKVTPEHPVVISDDNGNLKIKNAQDLHAGELLPLIKSLPLPDNVKSIVKMDLIESLKDLHDNMFVKINKSNIDLGCITKELEPDVRKRFRYRKNKRMPLGLYLRIEDDLNVYRNDISLYFKAGKVNYIPAEINIDSNFARLIGYFLSEGCISKNGSTYKIIWTFGKHEKELISDVCNTLKSLGIRFSKEKRESTIVILVSSIILAYLFKNILKMGCKSHEKNIPSCLLEQSRIIRWQLLSGIFRGDGSISYRKSGSLVRISYASTSSALFHQVLLLLQSFGVAPSIYKTEKKNNIGYIEGRKVNQRPLYQMDIVNYTDVKKLAKLFVNCDSKKIFNKMKQYKNRGDKFSYPRLKRFNGFDAVKIVDIKNIKKKDVVYDFKVPHSHLFVTTSGIITHNCMGIPTVGGETVFDSSYNGNILVNAFTAGLVEHDKIFRGYASGIGNPVIYVGSKTGRDGIHGATMASDEFNEDSEEKRPTVQVGDPFTEKLLLEACMEAFQTDVIVGIQDMGAAGLTSSSFEMASRAGTGIVMYLDRVPQREDGMTPYELLLSESQERMLMVVEKGREGEIKKIFDKWDLEAVVVGEVTDTGRMEIIWHGEKVVDMPIAPVAHAAPSYNRPIKKHVNHEKIQNEDFSKLPVPGDMVSILKKLLSQPSLASSEWVWTQYDHMVGTDTVVLPGSDAAVMRIKGTKKGIGLTVDCNSRYCYLDPYWGAALAVFECVKNLACSGARGLAITDCMNFGNPEKPEIMWQFEQAVLGISEACRQFDTPVVSGNVSFYNETEGKPIYPTPTIGMVGLVDDVEYHCRQYFKDSGDVIVLLGENTEELGGSEYLKRVHGIVAGMPPSLDFERARSLISACLTGIKRGLIKSAHDTSEGGLVFALAESCITGEKPVGATVELNDKIRMDALYFGEAATRIVVSVAPENLETILAIAQSLSCPAGKIGVVGGAELKINDTINLSIDEMKNLWQGAIRKIVE